MELENPQTIMKRMHTREFKEHAVNRANEEGAILSQVARDLDIGSNILRRWMKEKETGHWDRPFYRRDSKKKGGRHTAAAVSSTPARADQDTKDTCATLRQQLKDITAERDMLKNMLSYYLKG
jgi:transposase-like protein